MSPLRRILFAVPVLALLSPSVIDRAWAQEPTPATSAPSARPATSGADRFFLGFAEEAAIADSQWWEGDFQYTDDNPFDTSELRLVAAFQPVKHLEVGGRVGFGNTDGSGGFEGGTGATDLDAWGKYHFGGVEADTDFAAGGLVTVPTGDDTAGLGKNAFDFEAFGSIRHRSKNWIFAAQTGLRLNGDIKIGGQSFSSKNSWFLGGGAIYPASDRWSFLGEVRLETERIEGGDSDVRVLVGVDWHLSARTMLRGAADVGLTDGAPNGQFIFGYAATF